MKFVFWIIVIVAALLVIRVLAAKSAARDRPGAPPGGAHPRAAGKQTTPVGASEPMVRCAHCGIHLPRSEALLQGGQTWCGSEHARLGARQ